MLEFLIAITAFSAPFATLIDMVGSWKELSEGDNSALVIKIAVIASFIPPVLAFLGVSAAFSISKVYMSVCLLFIFMFGIGNMDELIKYKIPVLMEAIPCVISAISFFLQAIDVYAPISRFTWCLLDISFIAGKIILLNKKK